ncbi:MAG TPA: hypothetical protein VF762_14865, partial [Blastocatellia bacterium]
MSGASPATPYKGLIPYTEEDAPFFFGREPEREIITANLSASRLTLLYGPSGVGKSSVLRAGVAHHLRGLARRNFARRRILESAVVVFISWRDDPLAGLEKHIRDEVALALGTQSLEQGAASGGFTDVLRECASRVGGQLFVILDQFEEYFLYHAQEDGEGTFAVEFPRAVNSHDLRVSFLVSIREDALAKLDRFEGSIPNLFDNYLRIEHLDRDAGRAAIEKPIQQYNQLYAAGGREIGIEPALVEAVLDQVETGQVVLGEAGRGAVSGEDAREEIETPFLQLVMERLWNEEMRAGSRLLRLETLNNLGGAERIVRTHLDEAMGGLSSDERNVAAQIFPYLVTRSRTKIAYPVFDLVEEHGIEYARLDLVLKKLSGEEKLSGEHVRILRPLAPPLGEPGGMRYEIYHDVLAPAILGWRALHVQTQEQARKQADTERQLALEAQERIKAEMQLARERVLVRRQRWGMVLLGFLLLAMIGLTVFAFDQKSEANKQRNRAEQSLITAEKSKAETEVALSEAEAARDTARDAQAKQAEQRERAEAQRSAAESAKAEANRQRVAAEQSRTEALVQRDAAKKSKAEADEQRSRAEQALADAETSRDAAQTAAREAGRQRLIAETQKEVAQSRELAASAVSQLRVDPELSLLLATEALRVKNTDQAEDALRQSLLQSHILAVTRLNASSVWIVAFSPDGKYFVTGSYDNTARVWDAKTGESVTELRGHTGLVSSAAFSPDGKYVVTGNDDKTAQIWDVKTGESVTELIGHNNLVWSTAFSADGKYVVTGNDDKTAWVWDAKTGRKVTELRGHTGAVWSAAFSPDGKYVVTGSNDNTARIWEARTGQSIIELIGHTSSVSSAAFSPDGKYVMTGSKDNTVRVWDANAG